MNPINEHNSKYLKDWDIPEKGIRLSQSFKSDTETIRCLKYVQLYISYLCKNLIREISVINPSLYPSIDLICKTPIDLMEIGMDSRSRIFEGINKPKDIVKIETRNLKGTLLGDFDHERLDKEYRARHRLIILKLKNGKSLRKWNDVKRLLLHELSHTMCNHLMYYNDRNHQQDFDICEKLLKDIDERFNIEQQIKNDYGITTPFA
jgi:hypothetical protein